MFEAAKKVLAEAGVAMHAKEIYSEIVRRELYSFGAKNPVAVLSQSLSERSVGNAKNRDEIFHRTAPGTFTLAGQHADK